jgi:hypothetical protein
MDSSKWGRVETILDQYGIKPMVGVIPHNEDSKQEIEPVHKGFWEKVHKWEKKGWSIAMHGYNHCYSCDGGLKGLNPMWSRSEFAGLPFEEQRVKIRNGVAILRENGVKPKYFFAPSHTFDDNTIVALREESDIRIISDTIGRYPYKKEDFWFIPQIMGHCVKMPIGGIYTFCFHPNTMNDAAFQNLETFLQKYQKHFTSFDEIELKDYESKGIIDRLMSWAFFSIRRLRGLH